MPIFLNVNNYLIISRHCRYLVLCLRFLSYIQIINQLNINKMKTIKKIILAIIMTIISFLVVYLIWAFILVNINAFTWEIGSRMTYVLFSVIISTFASSGVFVLND